MTKEQEALRTKIKERILKLHPDIEEKKLEQQTEFRLELRTRTQNEHNHYMDKMHQEKGDFSAKELAKQCAKEWAANSEDRGRLK